MPYIPEDDRVNLRPVSHNRALSAGELNYQISMLLEQYLLTNGNGYREMNDVMGALEGAKMEFYRRFAAPYENAKIAENGDVFRTAPEITAPCLSNDCTERCGQGLDCSNFNCTVRIKPEDG